MRKEREALYQCEICGSSDANFQPLGGLRAWLYEAYEHEDELDDASRLMYELCYALANGDMNQTFRTAEVDKAKKQFDGQGWRVMCDLCASQKQ